MMTGSVNQHPSSTTDTDMSGTSARLSHRLRVWVDAVGYALVLAVVVTTTAIVLGIATGGEFVRGKTLTFLGGWLLVGYATVRLWPKRRDPERESLSGTRRTRFQRVVRAVPPVRWIRVPPPTDRVRPAGKTFLAGVLTLLVSLVMEVGFGVV